MKLHFLSSWQLKGITVLLLLFPKLVVAEVVPDTTLPVNSVVSQQGNVNLIEGGTAAGANLFHSFEKFSVPTGSTAYFNNSLDIQNIITRVTGSATSNIDGLIKASGTANLFLINPNGIIFGQNARLDIGGSFLATSATSMKFASGFEFGALYPELTPLLTVSVPIGLQYKTNSGNIQVQGSSLRVNRGQTLALVGGNVSMDGGRLLTAEGRIELASVAAGTVELNKNEAYLGLNFPNSTVRGSVSLSNGAELNVRGADKGSITINAKNIDISGASTRVRAGIGLNSGTPQSQAGDIELNATEAVRVRDGSIIANNTGGLGNAGAVRINALDFVSLDGKSEVQSAVAQPAFGNASGIFINTGSLFVTNSASLNSLTLGLGNAGSVNINARNTVSFDSSSESTDTSIIRSSVGETASGNGGDINITTGSLSLTRGSTLFSGVFGKGNAGSININARDTVTVEGENSVLGDSSGIRSNVFEGGEGNGGNININTGSLFVRNGGILNANIQSAKGKLAGNININARNTVSFDGINRYQPSIALSDNASSELGAGGNINITTRSLSVKNNAYLSTETRGQGNGGNIAVNTNTMDVLDGGQLTTTTFNSGKAGNITIKATDSVNLSGSGTTYLARFIQSDGTQYFSELTQDTGLLANTDTTSAGLGGDIRITAQKLTIQDQAQISVNSSGTGNAGSIEAIARSISLNGGKIMADTTAGQGNINLRSRDLILRRNSQISTNAKGENIIGGNINIDTSVLAAFENSDISANSIDFRGGNVQIKTQGIFGAQIGKQASLNSSDITASGANPQYNGEVRVTQPDVDLSKAIIELPLDIVDASQLVNQNFCARRNDSSFIITGRGGLPPSPNNTLTTNEFWEDWRLTSVRANISDNKNTSITEATSITLPDQIIEAQSLQRDSDGGIILVAAANTTPQTLVYSVPKCE